ncbi:hypothetical protein B0J11DRAFT_504149 [Dendryphion nanum]|uniref:Uncharacterized protein n=1 Tax=Dendryphion nanum TaxID=256645 RepID=A0A9P9E180_9PLEO|nr:hypothetical protein B0J11DRAFT_504149 [Dendryphion nanum]
MGDHSTLFPSSIFLLQLPPHSPTPYPYNDIEFISEVESVGSWADGLQAIEDFDWGDQIVTMDSGENAVDLVQDDREISHELVGLNKGESLANPQQPHALHDKVKVSDHSSKAEICETTGVEAGEVQSPILMVEQQGTADENTNVLDSVDRKVLFPPPDHTDVMDTDGVHGSSVGESHPLLEGMELKVDEDFIEPNPNLTSKNHQDTVASQLQQNSELSNKTGSNVFRETTSIFSSRDVSSAQTITDPHPNELEVKILLASLNADVSNQDIALESSMADLTVSDITRKEGNTNDGERDVQILTKSSETEEIVQSTGGVLELAPASSRPNLLLTQGSVAKLEEATRINATLSPKANAELLLNNDDTVTASTANANVNAPVNNKGVESDNPGGSDQALPEQRVDATAEAKRVDISRVSLPKKASHTVEMGRIPMIPRFPIARGRSNTADRRSPSNTSTLSDPPDHMTDDEFDSVLDDTITQLTSKASRTAVPGDNSQFAKSGKRGGLDTAGQEEDKNDGAKKKRKRTMQAIAAPIPLASDLPLSALVRSPRKAAQKATATTQAQFASHRARPTRVANPSSSKKKDKDFKPDRGAKDDDYSGSDSDRPAKKKAKTSRSTGSAGDNGTPKARNPSAAGMKKSRMRGSKRGTMDGADDNNAGVSSRGEIDGDTIAIHEDGEDENEITDHPDTDPDTPTHSSHTTTGNENKEEQDDAISDAVSLSITGQENTARPHSPNSTESSPETKLSMSTPVASPLAEITSTIEEVNDATALLAIPIATYGKRTTRSDTKAEPPTQEALDRAAARKAKKARKGSEAKENHKSKTEGQDLIVKVRERRNPSISKNSDGSKATTVSPTEDTVAPTLKMKGKGKRNSSASQTSQTSKAKLATCSPTCTESTVAPISKSKPNTDHSPSTSTTTTTSPTPNPQSTNPRATIPAKRKTENNSSGVSSVGTTKSPARKRHSTRAASARAEAEKEEEKERNIGERLRRKRG